MTATSPAWLANPNDVSEAKKKLDQHTYETVQWHFHESTGSPF
jgi:hypothetical protein